MRMRYGLALGLALGVAGLGTAQAQVMGMDLGSGSYYMRLEGGWNHLSDQTVTGTTAVPFSGTGSYEEGAIVGAAIGYKLGPWRLEYNFDYRGNEVSSLSGTKPPGAAGGSVAAYTNMLNGYFDLPFLQGSGFVPYVGVGIGAATIKLNDITVGGVEIASNNDTVFAIQPSVGLRYLVSPSASFGLEYRFLNGFSPTYTAVSGKPFNTGDYQSHSILVSFTYQFGAPSPPPPPVQSAAETQVEQAPAPTRRVFLVFFDFDKSVVTDAGRQVVAAAAAAYKGGSGAKIEATGYTDLAGTAAYNMALSKRRADAVGDLLVADGVPRDSIDLAWHGKEDPRVPTPDGVREPQNRRVEVVLP